MIVTMWVMRQCIVSMANTQAAVEVQDTKVADELINTILHVSYQGLSTKLKKVGT